MIKNYIIKIGKHRVLFSKCFGIGFYSKMHCGRTLEIRIFLIILSIEIALKIRKETKFQ